MKLNEARLRINALEKRIAELEQAIIDADSWLSSGEGINLLYYYGYSGIGKDGDTDERSKTIIQQILEDD